MMILESAINSSANNKRYRSYARLKLPERSLLPPLPMSQRQVTWVQTSLLPWLLAEDKQCRNTLHLRIQHFNGNKIVNLFDDNQAVLRDSTIIRNSNFQTSLSNNLSTSNSNSRISSSTCNPIQSFYFMIQANKRVQLTPWQHKHEEDLQPLEICINANTKTSNLLGKSIAVVTPSSNELVRLVEIGRQHVPRIFSNRERIEQPREKMRLKYVELASLVGIGKGMFGEIAMQKNNIQRKMMQYLLLVFIEEELRQESAVEKIGEMRQNWQCLFPLIGRKNKSKYGLNDFANQKL